MGKRWLIVVAGVVVLIVGGIMLFERLRNVLFVTSDLTQDYIAAQALRTHHSIYREFGREEMHAMLPGADQLYQIHDTMMNFHPPFTALLFVPFTFLNYTTAALLWSLISCALYAWIGVVLVRDMRLRVPRHTIPVLVGLALCWFPFQTHIAFGQFSLLIAACVVGCWRLLRQRHDAAAGILLGMACLIKLFPGLLFLYLLLRKRWHALASGLATLAVGGALILAFVGVDDTLTYFLVIAPQDVRDYLLLPRNASLSSAIQKLLVQGAWIEPLMNVPGVASWLALLGSLALLGGLAAHLWHVPAAETGDTHAFALVCVSMLLLSPITWEHSFVLALLPVAVLVQAAQQGERGVQSATLLALAALSLPYMMMDISLVAWYAPLRIPWYMAVPMLAPTGALLLLWWLIAAQDRKRQALGEGHIP